MAYKAKDDDLPDFFRTGKLPDPKPLDLESASKVSVALHYPTEKEKRQAEERERRNERSERSEQDQSRRVYVKYGKKVQMWDWLRSLSQADPLRMTPWEYDFCEKLFLRFQKYGPERVKWITKRQFDALHNIAAKHLAGTVDQVIR